MKKLLAIIFLLISNLCFSQLKSVIIDSETKGKVPYVNIWVENENIGTTSNKKGEFELNFNGSKIIIFSAIGFETKKIVSDSIKSILKLKPIVTELDEVVIKSKKTTQELKIGKFKKFKITSYLGGNANPWIIARYFEYKEINNKISFLKKIKLLTNSQINNSKFNIRLYNINNNGEPGSYINDENIIGIAKKGKKITEIDISNLNIEFPKEGFFIAIEWLETYDPLIGTINTKADEISWVYSRGKWSKFWKNNTGIGRKDTYQVIAIELTLTN
jgi:hypothetical protein